MKSKSEETWEEQFDRITKDNDGQFGHNIEFTNAKKFLSKMACLEFQVKMLRVQNLLYFKLLR